MSSSKARKIISETQELVLCKGQQGETAKGKREKHKSRYEKGHITTNFNSNLKDYKGLLRVIIYHHIRQFGIVKMLEKHYGANSN